MFDRVLKTSLNTTLFSVHLTLSLFKVQLSDITITPLRHRAFVTSNYILILIAQVFLLVL